MKHVLIVDDRELALVKLALTELRGAVFERKGGIPHALAEFVQANEFQWPKFAGDFDDFIDKLSEDCECLGEGFHNCGIPGVIGHVAHASKLIVERCDTCKRFASDQEAQQYVNKLGYE